jgi:hypothetical protein
VVVAEAPVYQDSKPSPLLALAVAFGGAASSVGTWLKSLIGCGTHRSGHDESLDHFFDRQV